MRIYAERAVPSELIEAARLAFVQTWNNYFLPLLMLSESKWYPLTIGLTQLGYAGQIVGSLLAIVPMIAAFVLLQRDCPKGLATGTR